jgi:hypothetical protein
MMVASVAPFKALLMAMAQLRGRPTSDTAVLVREAVAMGLDESTIQRILNLKDTSQIPATDSIRLYASYLDAVEQLTRQADRWGEVKVKT